MARSIHGTQKHCPAVACSCRYHPHQTHMRNLRTGKQWADPWAHADNSSHCKGCARRESTSGDGRVGQTFTGRYGPVQKEQTVIGGVITGKFFLLLSFTVFGGVYGLLSQSTRHVPESVVGGANAAVTVPSLYICIVR